MTPPAGATGPHALRVHEALALHQADLDAGLTSAEARERLRRDGPNELPEAEGRGLLRRLLDQFRNPLIYVLLGAALVTAAIGDWTESAVILAVVLLNGVVGFVQEGRAERALDALTAMVASQVAVLRDGRRMAIASRRSSSASSSSITWHPSADGRSGSQSTAGSGCCLAPTP